MMKRNSLKIFMIGLICVAVTGCIEMMFKSAEWGRDAAKVEAWKVLALQGDAEAQFTVGQYYCCGKRPRYDNVKALFWFCKAAKQGQRDAMTEVGKMYEFEYEFEGSVIPRDHAMSYAYYSLAMLQGSDGAREYREALMPRMTENEKEKANVLLKKWPNVPCAVSR